MLSLYHAFVCESSVAQPVMLCGCSFKITVLRRLLSILEVSTAWRYLLRVMFIHGEKEKTGSSDMGIKGRFKGTFQFLILGNY